MPAMTRLRLIALSCALFAGAAGAQGIDFISAKGPEQSCPGFLATGAAKLRGDAERVAYAICNTIDLAPRGGFSFADPQRARRSGRQHAGRRPAHRLEHMLRRVRASRVGARGRQRRRPLTSRIRPGEWAIDWNGDGQIDMTEKYLLLGAEARRHRIPRARGCFHPTPPITRTTSLAADQGRPGRHYWAVATCQFSSRRRSHWFFPTKWTGQRIRGPPEGTARNLPGRLPRPARRQPRLRPAALSPC